MVNPECKEGRLRGAAGAPDLGKSPSLEGSSDVGVVLGEVVVAQGVVNHVQSDWTSIFPDQSVAFYPLCKRTGSCWFNLPVSVELDWGPPRCSKCVLFGHSDDKCKRGVLSQAEPEVGFNKDVVPSQQAVAEECLVTVDVAASSAVCGDSDIRENAEAIGVDSNKLGNCDVPIVFTSHEPDILSQMNGDTIVDGSRVVVSVPSANMFDALCEAVEQDVVARPVRAAAGGVANLMKKFKPKEKGEEESEG
ncbi:hypothetical protein V6N11_067415 [Hibiscus sabdariffa]|uniref:Zinc knuckle CX2CX4HX4C domain-containing protein n=1 Tax=Hibiscus sabdariffa TaxID=183260 RepID=A0ABR2SR11_9ROSI